MMLSPYLAAIPNDPRATIAAQLRTQRKGHLDTLKAAETARRAGRLGVAADWLEYAGRVRRYLHETKRLARRYGVPT